MRKVISKVILPVFASVILATSAAFAQQPASGFDPKAFFEMLDKQRFKAPTGFDGPKFFADLEKQRFNNSTPKFDGPAFFEELKKAGFSAPADFDAKKFWADAGRDTKLMPPMVEVKQ